MVRTDKPGSVNTLSPADEPSLANRLDLAKRLGPADRLGQARPSR